MFGVEALRVECRFSGGSTPCKNQHPKLVSHDVSSKTASPVMGRFTVCCARHVNRFPQPQHHTHY